jgi:hypothetical protein
VSDVPLGRVLGRFPIDASRPTDAFFGIVIFSLDGYHA